MDDMLDEKEMQEVSAHLQFCSECKEIYNDLSIISQRLKDIEAVTIPENFIWKIPESDMKNNVDKSFTSEKTEDKKLKRKPAFNLRTFSAIAVVLVIGIVLSSEMVDFGSVPTEESKEVVSMARMEAHDEELLWEDVKTIEDEKNYYKKQIQKQWGQDVQIVNSNKDAEGNWHFIIRVNETLYEYEGKGGEIWIVE